MTIPHYIPAGEIHSYLEQGRAVRVGYVLSEMNAHHLVVEYLGALYESIDSSSRVKGFRLVPPSRAQIIKSQFPHYKDSKPNE